MELTTEEQKWIKSMQRLCNKKPKSLWLYSNGTMSVMKYPNDGSGEMDDKGSVRHDCCVGQITGILSEGGDW